MNEETLCYKDDSHGVDFSVSDSGAHGFVNGPPQAGPAQNIHSDPSLWDLGAAGYSQSPRFVTHMVTPQSIRTAELLAFVTFCSGDAPRADVVVTQTYACE